MDPVHDAGRMSWQMNLDLSEQLTIGLFVRDAAALHSELAWLPPVSPAVTGSAPQEPEEAGTQWDAWWTQAVARDRAWNGPDRPVLAVSWWTPPSSRHRTVHPGTCTGTVGNRRGDGACRRHESASPRVTDFVASASHRGDGPSATVRLE